MRDVMTKLNGIKEFNEECNLETFEGIVRTTKKS